MPMPAQASFAHTRRNRCSGCWNAVFEHMAHKRQFLYRLTSCSLDPKNQCYTTHTTIMPIFTIKSRQSRVQREQTSKIGRCQPRFRSVESGVDAVDMSSKCFPRSQQAGVAMHVIIR